MVDSADLEALEYERLTGSARKLRVIARVLELHRDGQSNADIASALGLHQDTVGEYLVIVAGAPGRIWKRGRE